MHTIQELTALLRLDDAELLFFRTPEGVDGAAIHKALGEAARRKQDVPTQNLSIWRLQVLAEAGRVLLAAPAQYAEAIHLTRFAALDLVDSAPLAHVRLIALGGLHLRHQLVAEIVRLSNINLADDQMSELIRITTAKYNIQNILPTSIALFNAIWGEIPKDLQSELTKLKANPDPNMSIPERGLRYLYDRSRLERCSYAEFKDRYSWGVTVGNYLRFILQLRGTGMSQHDLSRISSLQAQMRAGVTIPLDPKTLVEEHRNSLIMASHAGIPPLSNVSLLEKSPLPTSVIACDTGKGAGTSFNVSTLAPDATMNFLKLVKLVRKEPRLTLIFPDGGMGELANIDVLGVRMQMGRGAALLGYHGRAITSFICTRWEDESIRVVLKSGPSPEDGEPLDGFEQRLNGFYAASLEDVLSGPPEDFGILMTRFSSSIGNR